MLKFFRRIRQNLLSQNRFSKYLLYVLGEILLVVFGILIALYVNNLNIKKNLKNIEIEILGEIKSNLETNLSVFNRALATEEDYLHSNLLILDHLDHRKPFTTPLSKAFGNYFWTITTNPVSSGYDYLKSKGLDIVTNNKLRQEISTLYENDFTTVKHENEVWHNNLQQSVSYPHHVTLFRNELSDDSSEQMAIPFNYEALFNDNKFKSINSELIINRRWNISSLKEIIAKIEHLIMSISVEIDLLSK